MAIAPWLLTREPNGEREWPTFALRVKRSEVEVWRRAAELNGVTLGAWVRGACEARVLGVVAPGVSPRVRRDGEGFMLLREKGRGPRVTVGRPLGEADALVCERRVMHKEGVRCYVCGQTG